MDELEAILKEKNITFKAKDNRIHCYPHIINICVSHIVSSSTKVKAAKYKPGTTGADFSDDDSSDEDDDDEESEDEDYDEDFVNVQSAVLKEWFTNLKRDPVKRARVVVRTVRSSGQRKDDLLRLIRLGNERKSFKDEENNVYEMRTLQLLKDVRHRWDSLYLMLQRLHYMHPVRITHLPLLL